MSTKEIIVFVSHAEDTKDVCKMIKNIIEEETNLHYERDGYVFKPVCWDDIPRGRGDPQDIIDSYITDPNCRLIVMVLWTMYGHPTLKYDSGIRHEYELAKKHKKEMLILFMNRSIKPFSVNTKQLKKVQEFEKQIRNERYYAHCGFFDTPEDLGKKFRGEFVHKCDKFIEVDKLAQGLPPRENDFQRQSRGF